jgi:hypothetical protein
MSYFELFNEDVHDYLDNRSNVRTLFLPHTPLSSTPICPCPFSCSVLRRTQANADPHAQARIFPAHKTNRLHARRDAAPVRARRCSPSQLILHHDPLSCSLFPAREEHAFPEVSDVPDSKVRPDAAWRRPRD